MTDVISIEEVGLRHGGRQILDRFSLSAGAAEVLALLGPSGCGKSTVLRLVLGLVAPETGAVRVNGELVSISGKILKPPEERGIAVVFQDLALWPHLSVAQNLEFGLKARKLPRKTRERRVTTALARIGLGARAGSYPAELSGGERQRVAIARALVLEPRAVLLDEPLANLDVSLKAELLQVFRELLLENHATTVFVTHDLREARALGAAVAIMDGGRVVQRGALQDVCAAPAGSFARKLIQDIA